MDYPNMSNEGGDEACSYHLGEPLELPPSNPASHINKGFEIISVTRDSVNRISANAKVLNFVGFGLKGDSETSKDKHILFENLEFTEIAPSADYVEALTRLLFKTISNGPSLEVHCTNFVRKKSFSAEQSYSTVTIVDKAFKLQQKYLSIFRDWKQPTCRPYLYPSDQSLPCCDRQEMLGGFRLIRSMLCTFHCPLCRKPSEI